MDMYGLWNEIESSNEILWISKTLIKLQMNSKSLKNLQSYYKTTFVRHQLKMEFKRGHPCTVTCTCYY